MTRRYVLAPEAAFDLVHIWRFLKEQGSIEIADRVEDRLSGGEPRCRTLAQESDR